MGIEGTQSPILGDVVTQFIPFRKAVRDAVKNGRLPLWNRFVLAGEPLLANTQPAVLHPGTLIGFLLPLAQAWTFEMTLRHFLALLAMYLFLRELGLRELPSLLGAIGWCFSDYLVFFAGWQHSAAAPPFPLLLLALRRLVREPARRSVVLTVTVLVLIVTAGHPETLLHSVAAGGVYFLFELAFAGPGRRLRPVLLSLVAGGLALGISAVLLLPLVEALPYTAEQLFRSRWYAHVDKSASVPESLRRSIQDVMPYAFGVSGKGRHAIGFGEPAAYVGAVLLPFALLGLLSRRREKWAILALTFLGLAMWARLPLVTDVVSSLPIFDLGLNERMGFLAAFGISALAALGAQRLEESRGFFPFAAVFVTVAVILLLYFEVRPTLIRLEMPEDFLRGRLLIQLVPLALLGGLALLRSRAATVLIVAVVLLVFERGLEAGRLYPTFPNRAFYPPLPVLDPIPRAAPYRFTSVSFTFVPNISALYELEDVRGYEAMTFQPLTETFPLWCVPQPVWFNRVDDPTTPFLAFLNVRWVLAPERWIPPRGWKLLSEGEGTRLYENPRALARAFVPRKFLEIADEAGQSAALASIADFADQGIVGREIAAGDAGWKENGIADVRIDSYQPQRLALSVDARFCGPPGMANGGYVAGMLARELAGAVEVTLRAPAPLGTELEVREGEDGARTLALDGREDVIVGTSIPGWPGWKLEIDGRRAQLLGYNRAFLAFGVPAGRHRAVLHYWPDSFSAGLAVSGATLAACTLTALFRRRRAMPARAVP